MPELPEVESIKLQLQKFLVGHKIEHVEIRDQKIFEGDTKTIVGARVKGVRRFAKVIAIDFDSNYSILIHVKLTGQLIYRGVNLKNPTLSPKVLDGLGGKHTHVIFHLDRSSELYYNDFRRFGWIKIVNSLSLRKQFKFISDLGPEPLTDITNSTLEKLTLEKFSTILSSTRRAVKTLLMDQKKISGIGNIYANDALWLSQIHPERKSSSLSSAEQNSLFKAIETVLKTGLKHGGASELSFVTPDGSEGDYQNHFLAYGKDGSVCSRCKKKKFKRIKVGGRGTFFCPVCQR